MKVEKANFTTYNNTPKLRVDNGRKSNYTPNSTPKFKGKIPQDQLVKDIQKLMPTSLKMMTKFADSMGEISNILINAAGTGLVAPIFIKYNPLSKADEDTRTYSAWRQPISAILAIATQASMVAPFNSLLSNMSNNGNCEDFYNKTNFQDEAYIRKLLKKTNKNITSEQLDKLVKAEQEKQYTSFIENLRNKNAIYIKQHKAPTKQMDDSTFKNLLLETVKTMSKDDTKKLETCDTKKTKREMRSNFIQHQNDKTKTVLTEIDTELKNKSTLSEYNKYLSGKIKSLKSENANEELIKMVKEVLDRGSIKQVDENGSTALMKEMQEKVTKMLKHTEKYANVPEDEVAKHVEKSVADRKFAYTKSIEILKEIESDINASGENNKISIADIEKRIAERIKQYNITENCSVKSEFAKKVYTKYKDNIEGSLKGYKQFTGLLISLAVLPITCTLLNEVYPVFMDAVFPNLSNKKHDNEASALVAKAPKKEEV